MYRGQRVTVAAGTPPSSTSVRRKVYDADGTLLHENVWYSSYRGDKKIILVGTTPRPAPEPRDKPEEQAPPVEETAPPGDGPGV